MEAKEKAKELWTTYRFALSIKNAPLGEQKDLIAKQCALIAIEEIIKEHYPQDAIRCQYWLDVKHEVSLL